MCICHLFTAQLSLVILGQIFAARSESWYRKLEFCSRHSGFIIIDFDEAAAIQCWHYFSYLYFWFGYLVGMTCSRSQKLMLVVFFFIICSQFITFEQVKLCSVHWVWFVALLTSPYVISLRTFPYLFLGQFDSSVYIRIQFELRWPV